MNLEMGKQESITRKSFIQLGTSLFIGLGGWLWYRLSGYQTGRDENVEFRHNPDIPMGISYFGKYYLFRNETSVRAFSTSCTHAGCRIGQSNGTVLQCGCHGSQFDAQSGKPTKGPAFKTLTEFKCKFDSSANQWVVTLHPAENETIQS